MMDDAADDWERIACGLWDLLGDLDALDDLAGDDDAAFRRLHRAIRNGRCAVVDQFQMDDTCHARVMRHRKDTTP